MELSITTPRYSTVTELPVHMASREQMDRLYTRYRFASGYCEGKDVLEAACGAGIGLGYLANAARSVVGVDIDLENLAHAMSAYSGRDNINIRVADVRRLPFPAGSFDVVLLYEAIYYLDRPERFITEARRVLRDDGTLIVCSVNREWRGFCPSQYSHRYFSAKELSALLRIHGFEADLFGYCPVDDKTPLGAITGLLKVAAVRLRLMPETMKGKELLKRIFHGRLLRLPREITDGMAQYAVPVLIPNGRPHPHHKVIMAVARKTPGVMPGA